MKNTIWFAVLVLSLTACNKKGETSTVKTEGTTVSESPSQEKTEQMYSCSMHPEVTGKKGEKCPKCEMDLTEVVAQ